MRTLQVIQILLLSLILVSLWKDEIHWYRTNMVIYEMLKSSGQPTKP